MIGGFLYWGDHRNQTNGEIKDVLSKGDNLTFNHKNAKGVHDYIKGMIPLTASSRVTFE